MKEAEIEQYLLETLQDLKYTYRPDITDRDSLHANFRKHFNELNRVTLTDNEFSRLLEQIISPDVFKCSLLLRQQNYLEREDGTPLFYSLVNTAQDWCKNSFEVIHQLRINTDNSHHRYDVILLLNGLPLVQIELKSLDISPRRAIEQIVEYKSDAGNGYGKTLLCFMQIFIVSNHSTTWYFANNNNHHFAFNADERFLPLYKFADESNKKITHLGQFAEAFLAKCSLSEIISRYMVLVNCEKKLLMMRPYQIYAVQHIINCIEENCGNGYIWHTTGSGKTLTSFKASTLLKDNAKIEKCLFVVDRKDLDRQTREEFNRFQENCVEENTNTAMLVQRLLSEDKNDKVIVTTIQKLGIALDAASKGDYRKQLEPLSHKRIVFIFDECHRSQFGENHKAIKEFFPKAQLFGFTGTPIFDANAAYTTRKGEEARHQTTKDIFQQCLHEYTITHAIEDGNVLRFNVDYYYPEGEAVQSAPLRKKAIIEAILNKHPAATAQRKFNALFATASINDAIEFYTLFKEIQAERQQADPDFQPLHIACVFSPPAEGNKDIQQIQEDLPQEQQDNSINPAEKKAALNAIIADYNKAYKSNHIISEFDNYYKDIQLRIKNQQYPNKDLPQEEKIDITIVVDMLLTGFDSKYLGVLYVDKNLKNHGLIQAFSRTNRVLNGTKPWGKIVTFRTQQNAVDDAIKLFSGSQQEHASTIWLVDKAPKVIEKFKDAVQKLQNFMASQGLSNSPADVDNLHGDEARGQFINVFKEIQRLKTQLDQYTDLTAANKQEIASIVHPDILQAYRGQYLVTAQRLKDEQAKSTNNKGAGSTEPKPPAIEQLDFEFVLFASALIDYDYIMALVAKQSNEPAQEQECSRKQLLGIIAADSQFMEERELIIEYINTLPLGQALTKEGIKQGYEAFKNTRENQELQLLATQHGLDVLALQTFANDTVARMVFDGDMLRELFEPLNLDWRERSTKELAFMKDFAPLLRRRAGGSDISGLKAYE